MQAAYCSYLNKISRNVPDCLIPSRLFICIDEHQKRTKPLYLYLYSDWGKKMASMHPAYKRTVYYFIFTSRNISHTVRNVKDVHIKKVAVEHHNIKLKENVSTKNTASFSALCVRQASFHFGTRYCSFYVLHFTTFYPISSMRRQARIKSCFYFSYKHHEKL